MAVLEQLTAEVAPSVLRYFSWAGTVVLGWFLKKAYNDLEGLKQHVDEIERAAFTKSDAVTITQKIDGLHVYTEQLQRNIFENYVSKKDFYNLIEELRKNNHRLETKTDQILINLSKRLH